MSLYEKLQQAKSEEDVKDIYIKTLGLKNVAKGLVDIQTKEIRFEAKVGGKVSTYEMFSQLLWYVNFNLKAVSLRALFEFHSRRFRTRHHSNFVLLISALNPGFVSLPALRQLRLWFE